MELLFLRGHLYLIGTWFREDQRNKHHKDACLKEFDYGFKVLLTAPTSIVNTLGRTYVLVKESTNVHFHVKPNQGRSNFQIWFLVMLHCRYSNATQVSLCKFRFGRNWRT